MSQNHMAAECPEVDVLCTNECGNKCQRAVVSELLLFVFSQSISIVGILCLCQSPIEVNIEIIIMTFLCYADGATLE